MRLSSIKNRSHQIQVRELRLTSDNSSRSFTADDSRALFLPKSNVDVVVAYGADRAKGFLRQAYCSWLMAPPHPMLFDDYLLIYLSYVCFWASRLMI